MANRLVRYELGAGIGVAESSLPVVDVDSGRLVIGDSSPATSSTSMCAVAISNSGDIYVADSAQSVIYRVDESGTPFIFAGLYGATGNVDGDANTAKFGTPVALAVDRSGFVYVADNANGSVRRIDKNGNVGTLATGITRMAGSMSSTMWIMWSIRSRTAARSWSLPAPLASRAMSLASAAEAEFTARPPASTPRQQLPAIVAAMCSWPMLATSRSKRSTPTAGWFATPAQPQGMSLG